MSTNPFENVDNATTDTKMSVIYLPGQSGKTRKAQKQMERMMLCVETFENPAVVNIWMSSNNLTLESQSYSRLSRDEHTNNPIIWDSKGKKLKLLEIAFMLQNAESNLLVCCTNKRRVDQLGKLVRKLESVNQHQDIQINVWIDEADATMNVWKDFVELCEELNIVTGITLITASGVEKLIKEFGTINIHGYDESHPEIYHACHESMHYPHEQTGSAFEYVKKIIDTNPLLMRPGLKAYIPGARTQRSHEQIAKYLLSNGAAVFIINGANKELRMPDGTCVKIPTKFDTPEEMKTPGDIILEFYTRYNLSRFMTAIVGLTCTGRGITFQSAEFLLDYSILSHISNKNEAYQTACRTNGNIKGFAGYKKPMIISPSRTWRSILKIESLALNLCKIVNDRTLQPIGQISRSDIGLAKNYGDRKHRVFDTQQEAAVFVKQTLNRQMKTRPSDIAPQDLRQYVSETSSFRNPTKEEVLTRWWGVHQRGPFRAVPTADKKWLVYWQPSFITQPSL
jgi:hypothetical protein